MVARGLERLKLAGVSDADIPESMRAVEAAVKERGPGPHPMTGPVYVEGAETGDTLEIRLLTIDFLHPYGGLLNPGGGVLPSDFPYAHQRLIRWKPGAKSIEYRPGAVAACAVLRIDRCGAAGVERQAFEHAARVAWRQSRQQRSYCGLGVVFASARTWWTAVDRRHRGMQGDGGSDRRRARDLTDGDDRSSAPQRSAAQVARAETPTHYMTMGLDPDLDEATRLATREMVEYSSPRSGCRAMTRISCVRSLPIFT